MEPYNEWPLHLSRHFLSRDWLTEQTHVEITAGEKKGAAITGAIPSTPRSEPGAPYGVKSP